MSTSSNNCEYYAHLDAMRSDIYYKNGDNVEYNTNRHERFPHADSPYQLKYIGDIECVIIKDIIDLRKCCGYQIDRIITSHDFYDQSDHINYNVWCQYILIDDEGDKHYIEFVISFNHIFNIVIDGNIDSYVTELNSCDYSIDNLRDLLFDMFDKLEEQFFTDSHCQAMMDEILDIDDDDE